MPQEMRSIPLTTTIELIGDQAIIGFGLGKGRKSGQLFWFLAFAPVRGLPGELQTRSGALPQDCFLSWCKGMGKA